MRDDFKTRFGTQESLILDIGRNVKEIQEQVTLLRIDVAKLQTKSNVWSGFIGAISAIFISIIEVFLRR